MKELSSVQVASAKCVIENSKRRKQKKKQKSKKKKHVNTHKTVIIMRVIITCNETRGKCTIVKNAVSL